MTKSSRSTSTELTGGGGFDYEHRVAALYLTALARSELAPGTDGKVTRQTALAGLQKLFRPAVIQAFRDTFTAAQH